MCDLSGSGQLKQHPRTAASRTCSESRDLPDEQYRTRRPVFMSVPDSLRDYVPMLTRKTAREEFDPVQKSGISCFRRLVKKLKPAALSLPEAMVSPLELLVPLNKSPVQ